VGYQSGAIPCSQVNLSMTNTSTLITARIG
jgi:hypothetical protein